MSIKLDNHGKGKARISLRFAMNLESESNDPVLYLLIKNGENDAKYSGIDEDYNQRLDEEQFRRAAGAYAISVRLGSEDYSRFTIEDFPEASRLENKTAIHPKKITCRHLNYEDVPSFLKNRINTRDAVLETKIANVKRILQELDNKNTSTSGSTTESLRCGNEVIWILQFRIYLQDFVPEGTLRCWESSSKSWSVDFNIHKKRGYEDLIAKLEKSRLLRYPSSLELWFTIPHLHQFVASSPVYEKAFRMKSEDLDYGRKNIANRKDPIAEFETQEGDYSVKIVNTSRSFAEFSVICISPFLSGEKPEELSLKISEFERKAPHYVQWGDIMYPLGLFLAFLTLIFAVISVFVSGMGENLQLRLTLFTIIAAAIFFGVSVWGISMLCYILFSPQSISRKSEGFAALLAEDNTRIAFLTIGISIVVAVLTGGLIVLLWEEISSLLISVFGH